MRFAFLLVVSILPGIVASTLNPRSLADIILFDAPRAPNGMKWVNSVLESFCPVRDALSVSLMLRYRKFPYQEIYDGIKESSERQILLFENLFSAMDENGYHGIFFSPRKLQKNLILAKKIFLKEPVAYKGRFFAPGLDFEFHVVYGESKELAMAMLRLCIMEQMGMANDLDWLGCFLKIADENHAREIFRLFLDCHEMTPGILETLMIHRKVTEREILVNDYLYPNLVLPRNELLMRCALLSSVGQPVIYVECNGLEPHNNLDELREIALDRKDRQSISILFHCKSKYQINVGTLEMLEYVKLGRLSPAMTNEFIRWNFDKVKDELGVWPLEHLQGRLPRKFRLVPKEDRLSEWLCGGALMYEDVDTISLDNLYDTGVKMPINMRLTEPVEMKDGRIVTRAAEYFILNARAILDTYRGTRKAIPGGSYQKIFVGIFYALAEGRHLDFSSTILEMPEGSKEWFWIGEIVCYGDHADVSREAMRYLDSDEIYKLVHRAEVKPCVQDEEVAEVIEEIVKLSIA